MTIKSYIRSTEWFGKDDKMGFVHRSWLRNQGHPDHMFRGKPVIGICNTWSDLTPCNGHLREIAEIVKRGVYEAGGFPLEFPVMSLGETIMKPTTMLWRNLASMDVEETIRANPLDGVVLLNGCDKTTPSTLMGAASVNRTAHQGRHFAETLHHLPVSPQTPAALFDPQCESAYYSRSGRTNA